MVHFINVLLGQEEPRVLPGGSLVVQEILDTVYGSAATGREVRPC
jgi:predicted dehydrogenase